MIRVQYGKLEIPRILTNEALESVLPCKVSQQKRRSNQILICNCLIIHILIQDVVSILYQNMNDQSIATQNVISHVLLQCHPKEFVQVHMSDVWWRLKTFMWCNVHCLSEFHKELNLQIFRPRRSKVFLHSKGVTAIVLPYFIHTKMLCVINRIHTWNVCNCKHRTSEGTIFLRCL